MYYSPFNIENFLLFFYFVIAANFSAIIELIKIIAISSIWTGSLIAWVWIREKHNKRAMVIIKGQ